MKAIEIITEGYIAFELDNKSRRQLQSIFPPKYPDFIGHHITYKFGVDSSQKIPSPPKSIRIIGHADNGENLEALIVEINGKSLRPDGKAYHITWSLDRSAGVEPVHSNNLILSQGYDNVDPIDIKAIPKLL